MADETVPLKFGPGFVPGPSGWECMTDPIDVSEFGRATLVLRVARFGTCDGSEITLTVQESDDLQTWAEPIVPRSLPSPNGGFAEAATLALRRLWLRVKFAFRSVVPGRGAHRPAFHAELLLEKRKP